VTQAETAEVAYLDAIPVAQCIFHGLDDCIHQALGIFDIDLRIAKRQTCDQFGFCNSGFPAFLSVMPG